MQEMICNAVVSSNRVSLGVVPLQKWVFVFQVVNEAACSAVESLEEPPCYGEHV